MAVQEPTTVRMEMGLEVYEARERERELNQAFNSVVLCMHGV